MIDNVLAIIEHRQYFRHFHFIEMTAYRELVSELVICIDNLPHTPILIELPVFLKYLQEADQIVELW